VAFIASGDASYMTGFEVVVDGGFLAVWEADSVAGSSFTKHGSDNCQPLCPETLIET
jgi:hypothetical protein